MTALIVGAFVGLGSGAVLMALLALLTGDKEDLGHLSDGWIRARRREDGRSCR